MYALLGLLGLIFLSGYMLTQQRIMKSITALHAGTAVIGSGNLEFKIQEGKNDEMGDLSRAFNHMTANLKAVTASKADLEREIAERKRAEEALRESEARFRLALKNAPLSVAVQDRDLRYIWAYNQRSARPDQIIGHFDHEIFTADEAAHITAIKRRPLEEGVEHREQMWLDRPTGRMYLDICWEPIHDQAGCVTGVASATVDLTPIKVAEQALRESEERFRLFMDHSPTIAWIKDEEGRHIYLSKTYERRFDVRLEDWRGKTDFDLWPQNIAEIFRKNDLAVLTDNHSMEVIEVNGHLKRHSLVLAQLQVPIPGFCGQPLHRRDRAGHHRAQGDRGGAEKGL